MTLIKTTAPSTDLLSGPSATPPKGPLFQFYNLHLQFLDKLMAGVPKHPDLIASWLEARKPSETAFAKLEDPILIPALAEQVITEVQAEATQENKVWCGFKVDTDRGLYVDGYHVKAHLKDLANILQAHTGIKNLKAKLADRLFILEPCLYLGKTEPDGYWEHPVHVMTMQGPRSALKRNDYVERVTIDATLAILNDPVIKTPLLETILQLGSVKGFGAERGLGHGRYQFTLVTVPEDERRHALS